MRITLHTAFAAVLVPAVALALTGCGQSDSDPGASPRSDQSGQGQPVAVATTTQLGDITNQIARCAGSSAVTLMGVGDDPHDFEASSAQVAQMTRAPLVVTNGLGLEGGLGGAIGNAVADGARTLEVAPRLNPLPFGQADDGHDHDHEATPAQDDDHGHAGDDPHVWLDAKRMAAAAGLIAGELATVTGNDAYTACGTQVADSITRTDAEVRTILKAVPANRRIMFVDHQAWGYFTTSYGFKQAGVVIPGGSTNAEPSSAQLAALVKTIKDSGVTAIFSNNAGSTRLVDAVAKEADDVKVVQLFEGSLGAPGSGADTYQSMMTTNAKLVADALS